MPMRPLNLTDEPQTPAVAPATPTQPVVDDPLLTSHNQPVVGSSSAATPAMKKQKLAPLMVTIVVTVLLGVGTGFMLNRQIPAGALPGSAATPVSQVATGEVKAGDVFGAADVSAFKDTATGYLTTGGLDGEGSHSLLREGGASQTVFLTSSVTDLDKFEGMEIKVWGETFRGQKAGWLMDVGRIEVINPDGQQPE